MMIESWQEVYEGVSLKFERIISQQTEDGYIISCLLEHDDSSLVVNIFDDCMVFAQISSVLKEGDVPNVMIKLMATAMGAIPLRVEKYREHRFNDEQSRTKAKIEYKKLH